MGFSLAAWAKFSAAAALNVTFAVMGGNGAAGRATEAEQQFKIRIAGKFQLLQALADATGTARAIKFRKNGADGNQVINPTDATAGVYSDNVNSDAVVATDLVDLGFTSTGNPIYSSVRQVFKATLNHAAIYVGGLLDGTFFAATTLFEIPVGVMTSNTVEANAQLEARVAGSLQNAQAFVSVARSTNSTVRDRINGADGTIIYTLTASVTGLFEDGTHSDAIAAGDLWGFSILLGASGDLLTMPFMGCCIGGIATPKNDIFASDQLGGGAAHQIVFWGINGRQTDNATEAPTKMQHGFPVRTSRMRIFLQYNIGAVDSVMTIRKNGANGNQTLTLTGNVTGLFEDSSHTDDFSAGDDANYKLDCQADFMFSSYVGLTEQDLTPTGGQSFQGFII